MQTDRQDASAVGWDHQEKTQAHASQVDHKKVRGSVIWRNCPHYTFNCDALLVFYFNECFLLSHTTIDQQRTM